MARRLVLIGVTHRGCSTLHRSIAAADACRDQMRADAGETAAIDTYIRQTSAMTDDDYSFADTMDRFGRPLGYLLIVLFIAAVLIQLLKAVGWRS